MYARGQATGRSRLRAGIEQAEAEIAPAAGGTPYIRIDAGNDRGGDCFRLAVTYVQGRKHLPIRGSQLQRDTINAPETPDNQTVQLAGVGHKS